MERSTFNKIDFSKVKLPESIEEFFSKDEYQNMCDLEKLRFKNLRLNYEMMMYIGLPAVKPDFMRPKWGIRKQDFEDPRNSDLDEEWRPRPKRKSGSKPWRPPFRPPTMTLAALRPTSVTSSCTPKVKKRVKRRSLSPQEEPHVYSFRKRKEVNYMKLEVPNDDEFVYCEECNQEHEGDCPEHGPLLIVKDAPVPGMRRADPQRALRTLPPGLEVKESGIPGAGLGVFTTCFFPVRSRFGPYEGRRVTDPDIAHVSGYCWQICTDEGYSYFVDARDCKTANWMRYVNCARTTAEQNVTAYQHSGEVYYRAHCDIPAGTEILVWYGCEYGKELGIVRQDDKKKIRRHSTSTHCDSSEEEDDDVSFSDIGTSDFEFTDSADDESKQVKANNKRKNSVKLSLFSGTNKEQKTAVNNRTVTQKSSSISSSQVFDRTHKCQHCEVAFVLYSSLKIHMTSSHGDKIQVALLTCPTPVGNGAANGDISHLQNKDKKNMSYEYSKEVSEAGSMKTHKRTHTGDRPYVCDVCSKAFSRVDTLRTHKMTHTGDRPYVCDVCSKAFGQAGSLKTHKMTHTGDRPYVCDVCSKTFSQAGHLKMHKKTHTGDRPYVCDVCSKAFSEAGHLKRHKMTHTGDRPYVCDVCSKTFSQAGHLKMHKKTHTGDRPYVCDVCSKAFSEAGHLKRHKMTHTGDRPYVCDVCSKAFSDAGTLKRHKMTHTGDRPYVCDVCSKAFSDAGNLKTHKRTHTGDRPYVCDVCSKAFSDAGNLKTHKRTHTGDRPYVCDVCSKAFSEAGNLMRHKMTHTGDRPYVCDVCSKAFSQAGNLMRHKMTHTGDRPYRCTDCHSVFKDLPALQKHMCIRIGNG